jgi:hypothetical protein
MSTQQEAQQRAEKYTNSVAIDHNKPWTWDHVEKAFIAGEISGHQLAMNEMSAKAQVGVNEYTEEEKAACGNQMYGGKRHDRICDELIHAGYTEDEVTLVSVGIWKGIESEKFYTAPLLAEITALEAQNKKLGDVVLEMAEVLGELDDILQDVDTRKEIDSFTGQNAMVLMKHSANLIAKLKQERGE